VNDYVLDASAVLAALNGEPGGEVLLETGPGSQISSVNLGEVYSTLLDAGVPFEEVKRAMARLDFREIDFGPDHAAHAGQLRPLTRRFGQSRGDRACLAESQISGLPILSCDRQMGQAATALGIDIRMIR
jgi:PIN domain nuclease of toxin-antitoxin system